jgi:hypothetical protein
MSFNAILLLYYCLLILFSYSITHTHTYTLTHTHTHIHTHTYTHTEANILDFWYAAKMGYLEDVTIFCKCNVPLNETKVDRHTSERMTGLVYAAQYGHAECIKVMLQYVVKNTLYKGDVYTSITIIDTIIHNYTAYTH